MFHRSKIGRMLVVTATVVLLTLTAAISTACGDEGSAGNENSFEHPTGAHDVVLRVDSAGGFVPVSTALTDLPEFTLYGDGTVIVSGPIIMIYPGPAMPNLQKAKVSQETIQAILSAAQEAGLFDPTFDYGQPGITDMDTTTITTNVDGKTYTSSIYALNAIEPGGGLTMEQQQARATVSQFVGKLVDLTAFEQDLEWTPYEFKALTVYSSVAGEPGDTDVQPNKLDWRLADLATSGEAVQPEGFRKLVVTGDDLATLRPLLGEATQITLWKSGGNEYNLYFRPLLPDEEPRA